MKKHTTRSLKASKKSLGARKINMLTCYDFQTAQVLNETSLDVILVGDSLGNVVLGYETTVEVSIEEMKIFASAVRRGAPDKFVVVDMPFGSYATVEQGLTNAIELFKATKAEALKIEGAFPYQLELIERLNQVGIPVMGHIGLRPQSVHQQGGYFTHGKQSAEALVLKEEAKQLEKAGAFSVVLECVAADLATEITKELSIPTIGIGSGEETDGQVLVINDLLQMGPNKPPQFCQPISNLFELKKKLITDYLK